jgi:hypothetical protein
MKSDTGIGITATSRAATMESEGGSRGRHETARMSGGVLPVLKDSFKHGSCNPVYVRGGTNHCYSCIFNTKNICNVYVLT